MQKISIIIPVYNVEQYLHRCMHSILNQTYTNLEIILINDGATDNSGEICDDYASKDDRILVIHQKNKGLSGARNSGLKRATGEFVGFVDSDDWIEYDMFERMMNLIQNENIDVVECGILKSLDVEDNINRHGKLNIEDRLSALKRIITNQQFSVWRRLYKKKIIEDITFVEGKNSEDVYFTLDVFKNINKIAYTSAPLYNYFIGGVSITRGGYRLKTLDTVDAALHLEDMVRNQEKDEELKQIALDFLLEIVLYNYKLLNINNNLDDDYRHRKKLKSIIEKNYHLANKYLQLRLAKILPVKLFQLILKIYQN
ncbi:glycosyl transferase family 2 [Jejuia pallidilutea]|uniref:Glycosyl transferase family 2 n=1 Tax=Jejuia pallidilutea TaxID=504487 RepID=A0A362X7Y4_9FLAO|nr:glycosyltransferase [Jejuia pallidilutea]PQV47696.1 glycosyl transferase family 2 [Jejuia pallidilutea]